MTTPTENSDMQSFVSRLVAPMTPERLQALFDDLVSMQSALLEQGEPVSRLPLSWVALAEWVGLSVDLATGRIVDGPKSQVAGIAGSAQVVGQAEA